MPGPRKNLTPLDMKMMGLAFNQGGVINFLGKQPEVTAPVRAQSHADSPPVQLAYITDAEKDLLVKSNIHGSMDGKPNPGPAGLPSLDDFFTTPGGGIAGGSGEQVFSSGVDSGQQSTVNEPGGGGYQSSEAYGIQPGMGVSDKGQVFVSPLSAGEGEDQVNKFVYVGGPKQLELEALAEKQRMDLLNRLKIPSKKESSFKLNLPKLNLTFGKPIKELSEADLKLILDQYKLYKEGMPNYFESFPGGLNVAKGFLNSMSQGLERSGEFGGVKGSPTLEGLEKFIRDLDPDSNMLDAFKQAAPAEYLDSFGLPATDAGLDFFANLSLDDDTVDKYTQQKIIEARERLAENRQGGQGNAGQGIVAAAPSQPIDIINPKLPGPIVPDPTQPKLPITPQTPFAPFDINAFYASLPQYTQQGIMNPNLMSYYRNLGLFPGMAV